MAFSDIEQGFNRIPITLVELTVDGNIGSTTQTFTFSQKMAEELTIFLGKTVLPYLLGDPRGRPAKIQPDKALTERARMTLTFRDDLDAPAFDAAVFDITTGNTFWRRLVLTQPDLVGATVEVKRGYFDSSLVLGDFETIFKGRVEDFNQLANTNFQIIAKDKLAIADIQIPRQISDDNLLDDGTGISASDTAITVDKGSEFSDPANLSSKDFWPIVIRLDPDGTPEDIILNSLSGNVLTVQGNFLDKSEAFDDDPAWTKTSVTVTANKAIGPYGGDARADLVAFDATSDLIEQTTGESAGGEAWTFSVWLRLDASNSADTQTVEMEVLATVGSGTSQKTVTKAGWTRFEVSATLTSGAVIARLQRTGSDTITDMLVYGAQLEKSVSTRGFYAATDGNDGADAGRGAFGTAAASHTDNTAINEIVPYRSFLDPETGVHPVVIERDLVNRGRIIVADVDQSTFDREFAFIESTLFKRTILKPRKLQRLLRQVREQALLDLWISETGLVRTRLSFRQNLPGVNAFDITDESNILHRSAEYKGNKESRITEVYVYFNPVSTETEPQEPEDFDNVHVNVDLGVSAISGVKAKTIFSKWIFRSREAVALAGRLVSRFKRGARIAGWEFDLKDSGQFFLGDVLQLDSDDVPTKSGTTAVRGKTFWQVIQKEHKRSQGKIKALGLEFSGLRYAIISPDEDLETAPDAFPDFPDASAAEKQYGYIGDANNLVNAGTESGYFIL